MPFAGRSVWRGNMAPLASPEFYDLRGARREGTIMNEPEARHQHWAAFDAPLALLLLEPR